MDKSLWQEAAKRYWTKQDIQEVDDQAILNAMENDPEFKKYILDHENVFDVLEYAIEQDLKHKMDSWKGQNGKVVQLSNPGRRWRTFIARAATIMLIIVASLYFWPIDHHDQAVAHYELLLEEKERGGQKTESGLDYPNMFIEGKQLLQEKKYEEALEKMRTVIRANPDQNIVYDAEWNVLLILKIIDPKGSEYKELYMKIKNDKFNKHHSELKGLRKWGL